MYINETPLLQSYNLIKGNTIHLHNNIYGCIYIELCRSILHAEVLCRIMQKYHGITYDVTAVECNYQAIYVSNIIYCHFGTYYNMNLYRDVNISK